ncbi:M6 family metalloprotease domain-containing protein [Streptomyces griseoruber]|uniref:M6 family metalloprotease domain-containing protein n=1 Tax=Streptomyces griseoruber TaxID=1943 RepID=UPI0006E2A70B|nr:M6 family metalloprotease domain-containing protein [Streptomyces griseoruber]
MQPQPVRTAPEPLRRRIRPRRVAVLVSVTALTFAVSTSAGTGRLDPGLALGPTRAGAGPISLGRTAGLAPCMIRGGTSVQMSEGLPTPGGYARSTGTVRALTLMVDFSDAPGRGTALDRYREFFPQTEHWFRTASYGRLDYRSETPIRHWLRMPKTFRAYGIERGAPFDPGYRRLVQDIVAAADPSVDFRSYDLLNVLVTPNAGPSALDTVLSVTFAGNTEAPVADGVTVANASFVYSRQDDGSGSYGRTGYRVLPHENGHVFGLPDLYTQDGGAAVGHWDIMSEDWGANNDLLGWHKWKLGWLAPRQVVCVRKAGPTRLTLEPLGAGPGVPVTGTSGAPAFGLGDGAKLAVVRTGPDSVLAFEARGPLGNDRAACRSGILVYRISGDAQSGRGPVEVIDAHPRTEACWESSVYPPLADAPVALGENFTVPGTGVRVQAEGRTPTGAWNVKITLPRV